MSERRRQEEATLERGAAAPREGASTKAGEAGALPPERASVQKDLEAPALSYRIDEQSGSTVVTFSGEVDENADFGELTQRLAAESRLVFELGEVRRINSCGVREWVNFVRELGSRGASDLSFVSCSPAIVTQLNMIYNFRGPAKVRSFLAPYVCSACDHETEKLLEVATHFPGRTRRPPDFVCERCAAPLEFDDPPERYLSFLNEQ